MHVHVYSQEGTDDRGICATVIGGMPALSPAVRWLLRTVLTVYRWFATRILALRRWLAPPAGNTVADERVLSGRAWDEFCDTLKAAGAALAAPGAPQDAFSQAEGYRYLSRLVRAGLENFECTDVQAPRLCAIANGSRAARICIGSDNPDNLYENAVLDSRLEYVVRGERGTVNYLGLGTQSGSYGAKGGLSTVDYLDAQQLVYDEPAGGHDGQRTFTVVLSATRPTEAPNWLRLASEPREAMLIVRQTFGDRRTEVAARLSIERRLDGLDGIGDGSTGGVPSQLTAARLDEGLQSAAVLVAGASAMLAGDSAGL